MPRHGINLTPPGVDPVLEFLTTHPNGPSKEQLREFLGLIYQSDINGTDLIGVMQSLALIGVISKKSGQVAKFHSRVAEMALAQHTKGLRGQSENKIAPSLMWLVAELNADNLGNLISILKHVLAGRDISDKTLTLANPAMKPNASIAEFIANHPKMLKTVSATELAKQIEVLLEIVDTADVSATQLFYLIRMFDVELSGALEKHIRRLSGQSWLAGDKTFQAQLASRGKHLFKPSLLWAIVESQYRHLPQLNQFLYTYLLSK